MHTTWDVNKTGNLHTFVSLLVDDLFSLSELSFLFSLSTIDELNKRTEGKSGMFKNSTTKNPFKQHVSSICIYTDSDTCRIPNMKA